MIVKTQITFKEYLKLLLGLTYRKPMMILILLVDLAMMVWILGYYLDLLPVPKPKIYQFITLILISFVQPFVIYNTIRQNYNSSSHLKEPLEIEITTSEIRVKGESFYTKILWNKIFKIVEYNNWFLVYQNNLSAIIIHKKDFQSNEQDDFLKIIKNLDEVPKHLK